MVKGSMFLAGMSRKQVSLQKRASGSRLGGRNPLLQLVPCQKKYHVEEGVKQIQVSPNESKV